MIQRPKGTQDLLPGATPTWQQVEALFRAQMHQAGYGEIRTPIFEATDLFVRGVGESTDIVHKEMYSFEKGERSITLRPEGTAGVVRAFIENGLSRDPKPVRLFYVGPMFRYERPQAGRQRQFHQAGLELFGLNTPQADAEAVWMAVQFLQSLHVPGLQVAVNNLGTQACRERFKQSFNAVVEGHLPQLCSTCQTRFDTNPMRMLDCKDATCRAFYDAATVGDLLEQEYVSEESQAHFEAVCQMLTRLQVPWQRNRKLVRGLDYYTGLVFEITATGLGAQNVVCGGGRYDGLVEMLGGPATPAVGWAVGMERLLSLATLPQQTEATVAILSDDTASALQLATTLRSQGQRVLVDISGKPLGKQLAQATKLGATVALILGENERAQGTVTRKDLTLGTQEVISLDALQCAP
jgi:histidyl-tRNA synthetase